MLHRREDKAIGYPAIAMVASPREPPTGTAYDSPARTSWAGTDVREAMLCDAGDCKSLIEAVPPWQWSGPEVDGVHPIGTTAVNCIQQSRDGF